MLTIKWRMIQLKLRAIAKTMEKSRDNLCRQALIAGQKTCNKEDLLTYSTIEPELTKAANFNPEYFQTS